MRQSWRSTSTSGVSVSQRRLHSSSYKAKGSSEIPVMLQRNGKLDKQHGIHQKQVSGWHVRRKEETGQQVRLYPDLLDAHETNAKSALGHHLGKFCTILNAPCLG